MWDCVCVHMCVCSCVCLWVHMCVRLCVCMCVHNCVCVWETETERERDRQREREQPVCDAHRGSSFAAGAMAILSCPSRFFEWNSEAKEIYPYLQPLRKASNSSPSYSLRKASNSLYLVRFLHLRQGHSYKGDITGKLSSPWLLIMPY